MLDGLLAISALLKKNDIKKITKKSRCSFLACDAKKKEVNHLFAGPSDYSICDVC